MRSTDRWLLEWGATLVACALALVAAAPLAKAAEISPIARWAGQVGKVGSGDSGYFCSPDALQAFWRNWQIAQPQPDVDFARQLAIFHMGSGGPHLMSLRREEGGDLVAEFVQTPTASRYPNYLIVTVPRDGIISLNGTPLACPEPAAPR